MQQLNLINLRFEKDKNRPETKNTFRYQEIEDEDGLIKVGVLYIQKWAAKELGNPEVLEVTIGNGLADQ